MNSIGSYSDQKDAVKVFEDVVSGVVQVVPTMGVVNPLTPMTDLQGKMLDVRRNLRCHFWIADISIEGEER